MLVAMNQASELVTLTSRKQAETLRHEAFSCPACHRPVLVKSGRQVTPHFAHRHRGCTASEPETEVHLQGKWWLKAFGEQLGYSVELEVYLPMIKQRADLIWVKGQRRIAIEYQCSNIKVPRLIERTEGYRQLGLEVIWIMGPRYFGGFGQGKQLKFMQWVAARQLDAWFLDVATKRLQRVSWTPSAMVTTQYTLVRGPKTWTNPWAERPLLIARQVSYGLRYRTGRVMQLQQQAATLKHNIGGLPLEVFSQLSHLPGMAAREWQLRVLWLLRFDGHLIKKTADHAFWREQQFELMPLSTVDLIKKVRSRWLAYLLAGGYLVAEADTYRWAKPLQWYPDQMAQLQAFAERGYR